jgi:hypothetical protein
MFKGHIRDAAVFKLACIVGQRQREREACDMKDYCVSGESAKLARCLLVVEYSHINIYCVWSDY